MSHDAGAGRRVVALVSDLMDRSRISVALPDAWFVADAGDVSDADVVIIDLGHHPNAVGTVRRSAPEALIVAFGSHVDEETLAAARLAGADRVLPRSRFFRDPPAAMAPVARACEPDRPDGRGGR